MGLGAFLVPLPPLVQYIPAMAETLKSLPDNADDLKDLIALMGKEIKSLTLKVEDLQGQLAAHPLPGRRFARQICREGQGAVRVETRKP